MSSASQPLIAHKQEKSNSNRYMETDTLATFGNNTRVVHEARYLECLGVNDSFPFKLHLLLAEMEEHECSHIVSWQPHGRSFIVHQRKEFVKYIMPSFFRMSKYASFQRQLNIYGFHRVCAGPDKGAYYHKSFIRSRLDLSFEMRRQKVKGTYVRQPAASSSDEPNFYNMPFAPPSIPTRSTVWAMPSLSCPTTNASGSLAPPQQEMTAVACPSSRLSSELSLVSMMALQPEVNDIISFSNSSSVPPNTRSNKLLWPSRARDYFDGDDDDVHPPNSQKAPSSGCRTVLRVCLQEASLENDRTNVFQTRSTCQKKQSHQPIQRYYYEDESLFDGLEISFDSLFSALRNMNSP